MANTEILKVLQVVREAKEAVNGALGSHPGEKGLEELSVSLEAVEGILILSAVQEKVNQLQQYKEQLEKVNARMEREMRDLKVVSEKVGKAAKALGLAVEIIAKSAALGAV